MFLLRSIQIGPFKAPSLNGSNCCAPIEPASSPAQVKAGALIRAEWMASPAAQLARQSCRSHCSRRMGSNRAGPTRLVSSRPVLSERRQDEPSPRRAHKAGARPNSQQRIDGLEVIKRNGLGWDWAGYLHSP